MLLPICYCYFITWRVPVVQNMYVIEGLISFIWLYFLFLLPLCQALDDSVAGEEKTLQHIEALAELVRANTSPAGAEMVVEEAEELRLGWQRLRQGLCETEEGLRSSLDSHSQYMARCQRLRDDIGHLRALMQNLTRELEENREAGDPTDYTEEKMVGQWRKYTVGSKRLNKVEIVRMSSLLWSLMAIKVKFLEYMYVLQP